MKDYVPIRQCAPGGELAVEEKMAFVIGWYTLIAFAAAVIMAVLAFKGRKKDSWKMGAVGALVITVIVGMFVPQATVIQTGTGGSTLAVGNSANGGTAPQTYISTGATSFLAGGADALDPGTSLLYTYRVSVNDGAFGAATAAATATSVSPNQKLNVLFTNNTIYHNAVLRDYVVPTSPTANPSVGFYKNTSLTMTVFNTDLGKMTSGACAAACTNQTVATGGSYNMRIRLDGQDLTSTNDMVCVLEASSSTKMDKMILNGFGATYVGKAKPASYSLAGATSDVWVYEVPAITGAQSVEGTISAYSKSAQSLAATDFYVTCRSKEWFLDSKTGKLTYAIEDSYGTMKSMASYNSGAYHFS